MTDEAQRLLSIFSNSVVTVPNIIYLYLIIALFVTKWKETSTTTKVVGFGVIAWLLGELVRIGYWVPAIWLARYGEWYHPWFIQHRYISYILAAPLLVGGMVFLMVQMFPTKKKMIAWMFALGVLISAGITWAFYASEHGVFDRDGVVDWWDGVFGYEPGFTREVDD